MMQVDGGRPLQITHHPASEWPLCFSPDGRRLYFSCQLEGDFASYWVPAFGGDETRVTEVATNRGEPAVPEMKSRNLKVLPDVRRSKTVGARENGCLSDRRFADALPFNGSTRQ